VHSSLLLMLHYLRTLYNTGLVPDVEEFNRLVMLAVAEVADNTAYVGMRDYPALEGPEGKKANKDGSRYKRPSVQNRIVTAGMQALERCATKYLDTGGGRFASQLSPMATAKRRKRGPGKALKVILRDFQLFDNAERAAARHLPAASLHGVKLPERLDDPRFACGVLRKRDRTTGSVSIPKLQTLHATMKKLFKYVKKVGVDLAKSLTPEAGYEFRQAPSTSALGQALNCVSKASGGERNGILQNLLHARQLLDRQATSFPAGKSLIRFLEAAVTRIMKTVSAYCSSKLGQENCNVVLPKLSCGHRASLRSSSRETKSSLQKLFAEAHDKDAAYHKMDLDHEPLSLELDERTRRLATGLDTRDDSPSSRASSSLSKSSGGASSSSSSSSSSFSSRSSSRSSSRPSSQASSSSSSRSPMSGSGLRRRLLRRSKNLAAGSKPLPSSSEESSSSSATASPSSSDSDMPALRTQLAPLRPPPTPPRRRPAPLLLRRAGAAKATPSPSSEFATLKDRPLPTTALSL